MSVTEDSRTATLPTDPMGGAPPGPDSLDGHDMDGTQSWHAAEGQTSPQANQFALSNDAAPAGSKTSRSQPSDDTHYPVAAADDFPGGQPATVTHGAHAAGDQAPPATANNVATTSVTAPWLADKGLGRFAVMVEDLEKFRIANQNRLRPLVTPADRPDKDGVCRGIGWLPPGITFSDEVVKNVLEAAREHVGAAGKDGKVKPPQGWHKPVWSLCTILLQVRAAEDMAVAELEAAVRAHALGPFQKSVTGLGAKQLGRLLGIIGDPYIRAARIDDDSGELIPAGPRTEGQLRALCGHGDPDRKPFKGMTKEDAKALGRPDAKKHVRMIAVSAARAGVRKLPGHDDADGYDLEHRKAITPLGQVYLDARALYATRVHEEQCQNHKPPWQDPNGCGTRANPELGAPGSPWRDGHQHAAALRLVGQRVLDSLYDEAKRLHEERDAV